MFWNKKTILLVLALLTAPATNIVNADFTFGTPVNLGPAINTSERDTHPAIAADGLSLFFVSDRPGGYGTRDIWVTTRVTTKDEWSTPINLGPNVNTSSRERGPSISGDGLSLYFASDQPGGYGGEDILVSTRSTLSDPWGKPVNLGSIVNNQYRDSEPSISHDGLELYFGDIGSGPFRPGGYDGGDLWVTMRATIDESWSTPVNLGATVNSSVFDAGANISSDGLALFYMSRTGSGDLDILLSRRTTTDDPWSTPVNLGPPVNTSAHDVSPSISIDGSTLYFASTRHGGSGRTDLYKASIYPVVDLNSDGIVDSADLSIIVDHWGTDDPLCDIGPMPWGDGIVDVQDLIVLAEHLFEGLGDNVWEGRISIATDDEEEYADTASYDPSSSDLEMPYEREGKSDPQVIGLRFSDVRVPKGANVLNAYIEFVCDETKGGTEFVSLLIEGELSPDAAAISTAANYNISSRSRTAANAVWEPVDWTAAGQVDQTSNIASVIQEIVNQDGWASGNALVIIIGDNPGNPSEGLRCAESYDGSPSAAPLLHIEIAVP